MPSRRSRWGSVIKRQNGRFTAYWTNPITGKRKSIGTFDSLGEAWDRIDEMKVNRMTPGWIDPSAGMIPFGPWASDWIRDRPNIRQSTRNQYHSLLRNHLNPTFGESFIGNISPVEVRAWYAALMTKSPGTAPAAYRLLRAILNTAVEDGLMGKNPCRDLRSRDRFSSRETTPGRR